MRSQVLPGFLCLPPSENVRVSSVKSLDRENIFNSVLVVQPYPRPSITRGLSTWNNLDTRKEKNLSWKVTCIRLSCVYVYEEETWLVMDLRVQPAVVGTIPMHVSLGYVRKLAERKPVNTIPSWFLLQVTTLHKSWPRLPPSENMSLQSTKKINLIQNRWVSLHVWPSNTIWLCLRSINKINKPSSIRYF